MGRAAQRALARQAGQWEHLGAAAEGQAPLSFAGNVNEAAQAVKIGAADATLVWDATARQFGLDVVEVPGVPAAGPPNWPSLGVVAAAQNPTAALHFARYLTARDRGQVALSRSITSSRSKTPTPGRTGPRWC